MTSKLMPAVAVILLMAGCNNNTASTTAQPQETANTVGESRVLRIATEGAYPPFNDLTADNEVVGFDIDVMKAICAKIEVQCQFTTQDWDGLIPGLTANRYDAIIAGMSVTPERSEVVDFTEPYFSNTIVWLSKTDGSFDPNSITGKVLGGQRATTGAAYIAERYDGKDGNRVQLYDSYINAYLDLRSGRNDAVMAEKVSAADWLASEGSTGFGLIGDEIDNNDNIAIAVRKGDPLKAEFDRVLAELKASGELAKIEEENFHAAH